MAGVMTTLSSANTLLAALNNPLIKEAFLSFSYGNRLKKLKRTVTAVKNALLDAANVAELSEIDIEKLKGAVYDADDMFDELLTQLQRKQLFDDENNVEKVCQKLPSVENTARLGLSIDTKPHRTFSHSNLLDVVERDNDAKKVIDMLLDSTKRVYYLAIVGIGGVGKTTLAKLVFDDKRIKDEFPVRLWVCVSDQDRSWLDVKQILLKILEPHKFELSDSLTVEYLQLEYKRKLEGKKFLLVLDDICCESILELRNLKELLMIQGSVSRIIATTQSKETARIIGNDTHLLEGLPQEGIEYDADDMLDTLVTKAVEKVRQLLPSVKTSLKLKKLRLRMKDIADDHAKSGLSITTEPHRRLRVETFSNVYAPDVVGRDGDVNKVIGMLLDSERGVYFLAVVGIGGVGKTTLVKLVFDDKRITDEFPIRLWVGVSDKDGTSLDEKQILLDILAWLGRPFDNSLSLDSLQLEYQRNSRGKKFLLVLDGISSEEFTELDSLKRLLTIDGSKSRIIATTRSPKTAAIIVGDDIHDLKSLSDEHSRCLFEMVAFQGGQKPPESVAIVEKIVKESSNVPLVIKVIGSLLYGQPIDKWQTLLTSSFNKLSKDPETIIMTTLRSSYDYLDPSLKSCFAYCAIFPKNYVISKEMIINLWVAQGYIVPFVEGQSIEDAGEEHFSVLLQRCFFQDVQKNEWGDVESFKLHDLMHDLAQRVSGKEICMINSSTRILEGRVRHLFASTPTTHSNMPKSNILHQLLSDGPISKIRSYFMLQSRRQVAFEDELLSFEIAKNGVCLRALSLRSINGSPLDALGNLIHLRYLNLSHSNMKKLPNSIEKLYNLQTLDLTYCLVLEEWPKEFCKLLNLTHLYTDGCLKLSYMPVGMSNLSSMRTLTEFVVEDESASRTQCVAQLTDLKALVVNLKGRLSIRFGEEFKGVERYDWEGSFFEHAEYLNEVDIDFSYCARLIDAQIVMEKLKPHRNLKKFRFSNFESNKIATWGSAKDNWATFFPNLVSIRLFGCRTLQELPMLSKLLHLKSLSLSCLNNLEYIEEEVTSSSGSGSFDTAFFPSLEFLDIWNLENLKSWRRPGDCSESHCQPAFPILSYLNIWRCSRLESFPPCLSRPKVDLHRCNKVVITTADGVHTSPN